MRELAELCLNSNLPQLIDQLGREMELKVEMHFLFHCLVNKSGYTTSANAQSWGPNTMQPHHPNDSGHVGPQELEEAVLEGRMSVHGAHVRILDGATVRREQGQGCGGIKSTSCASQSGL